MGRAGGGVRFLLVGPNLVFIPSRVGTLAVQMLVTPSLLVLYCAVGALNLSGDSGHCCCRCFGDLAYH